MVDKKDPLSPSRSPLSPTRSALQPITSAASRLSSTFSKIDLAAAPLPVSRDPALEPTNQHLHGHKFHTKSAHDKPTVYANVNTGPREDFVPEPHHAHHSGEKAPETGVSVQDGSIVSASEREATPLPENATAWQKVRHFTKTHTYLFVIFWGLFFTAWWVSIIAQKRHRHMWLIPTVLWILLMARLITFYVPTRPLLKVADFIYQNTFVRVRNLIPQKLWPVCEGIICMAVILIATFATPVYPESSRGERAVSFAGFWVFYLGFFVFSRYKSRIRWHTVFVGIFMQYIIALFVLRTKAGFDFFDWISFLARKLLSFAQDGVAFLLSADVAATPFFMLTAIPSIIFFIAFIHIWYYWGILQWLIGKFAAAFFWAMDVSGAEAVVAAASPFVGQGESAILVKPFIEHMTDAELYQILTSGFATISGSVLAAYINLGLSPQALITSCVMSIPASLAAAKLVYPETEEPLTANRVVVPEDTTEEAFNVLHAFSNGAWLGLQIAFSIITNLLCIIALVALVNALLGWFAGFWNIHQLTLEQIMGYIFYPVAFLLGILHKPDIYPVAKLLGTKMIQNEFVAYAALSSSPEYAHIQPRSRMLATYALCGFSNLGSVAIQIAVLGQVAPTRKGRLAQMAMSALVTGTFTTYSSAAAAGMVMADLSRYD